MLLKWLVYSASFCYFFFWLQNHHVSQAILGGENHALRFHAHHRAVLEVEDESTLLAHEIFRLVPLEETSDCCSFLCAEINSHFDEVSGARNVNGFYDFAYAKVEFLEFVKRNVCVERAQGFTRA